MTTPNNNPIHPLIDPAMIRTAVDQARQSARQLDDVRAANAGTIKTLETALDQGFKGPLNDLSTV